MTPTRVNFFRIVTFCSYLSICSCAFAQITPEKIASADIKELKIYIQKIKDDRAAVSNSVYKDNSQNRILTLLTGDNEFSNIRNQSEFNQIKESQIRGLDSLLAQAENRVSSIAAGYLSSSKFTEDLDKNGGKLSNNELKNLLELFDYLPDKQKSQLSGTEPQKVIASLTALAYKDKETMNLYWSYLFNKIEEIQKETYLEVGVVRLSAVELKNIASLMLTALASDDEIQIDLVGQRFGAAIDYMMQNHLLFIKPESLVSIPLSERKYAIISLAGRTNDSTFFVTMGTNFQKLYKDTKRNVIVRTERCILM